MTVTEALDLLGIVGYGQLASDPTMATIRWQEMQAEAKKAHRKLALAAHPDHGGSTEQMARLNKAAEVIAKHQHVPRMRQVFRPPRGHPGHAADIFGPPLDQETMAEVLRTVTELEEIFGRAGMAEDPSGLWERVFSRQRGTDDE